MVGLLSELWSNIKKSHCKILKIFNNRKVLNIPDPPKAQSKIIYIGKKFAVSMAKHYCLMAYKNTHVNFLYKLRYIPSKIINMIANIISKYFEAL